MKENKELKDLLATGVIVEVCNEIEPFINEYDIVLRSEDDDLERNIKIIKSLCE